MTSITFVPGAIQFKPDEPSVLNVLNSMVLQQALAMAQVCRGLPAGLHGMPPSSRVDLHGAAVWHTAELERGGHTAACRGA